ncbi:hypothetical protein SAMN05428947_106302 [Mucilaginibacter sp. OK283]|jgi:hypothetical protein|nr:hypothetical protein SAMN05428947_106302 [Mucilaginibacter sp. OK283]
MKDNCRKYYIYRRNDMGNFKPADFFDRDLNTHFITIFVTTTG